MEGFHESSSTIQYYKNKPTHRSSQNFTSIRIALFLPPPSNTKLTFTFPIQHFGYFEVTYTTFCGFDNA